MQLKQRMERILGLLIISLILLIGCNKYREIEEGGIKGAFILNSSLTFKGYYYKGSDTNFHYFISKWDFRRDVYFKIPVKRLNVIKSFKLNEQEKEIKIDLQDKGKQEFGESEFCKLFFVE